MSDLLDGLNLFELEPTHEPYSHRMGIFYLSFALIQVDPEAAWRIMLRLKAIVTNAQVVPHSSLMQYIAYSPLFEEWEPPAPMKIYEVLLMRSAEETETITVRRMA